ncbi:MAG: hypothetical protein ACJ71Z_03700 [Aeromicrobium sp.]
MRMLIRSAVFAVVIGVYYGIAALLPDRHAEVAGLLAFVTVMVGAFLWARHDGRRVPRNDGLRDWLVVAAVIAVFWWTTLTLFEGSNDVMVQLRLNFLSILATAGVTFAAAAVGFTLGRSSRG